MLTAVFGLFLQYYYIPYQFTDMAVSTKLLLGTGYYLLVVSLEKTYHALTIGLVRVSELIYSQFLAVSISSVIYFGAASLYARKFIACWPLLVMLIIQVLLSVAWSLIANKLYYKRFPAPRTVIVYQKESELERIRSIRYFAEHFDVQKLIAEPAAEPDAVCRELEGYQAVFVAGVHAELSDAIAKYCVTHDIKGYFVPRLSDIIMAGAEHMPMFSEPIMKVQRAQTQSGYLGLKRVVDIFISLIALILTSPISLLTALAIKVNDGGPVFYRQTRLTQNGRTFAILKFRSMNVNAERDGIARLASENDQRITPVGKFIRSTRIDELPQLINILLGDMSLVGPRPERPEIAAEYAKILPEFALRLQVKAGLTGMAQVYGRYNTEPYTKLQMDLMYINKLSLMTDLSLLFSTLKILFMKESTKGVNADQITALLHEERPQEKHTA